MYAHKEIAVGSAKERTAGQIDERIGRASEDDIQTAPHELGAEQFADPERDVFLGDAVWQCKARVPGVDAAVTGIDDNCVRQAKTRNRVGERG
jgi:hypothetical protein